MKRYRVIYHIGDSIDIKTKVESGVVVTDDKKIMLISKTNECIADLTEIPQVSLFMMNGVGSMLRLETEERTIYLSVVRFCIAGQFAMGNALGTRALKKRLESLSFTQ